MPLHTCSSFACMRLLTQLWRDIVCHSTAHSIRTYRNTCRDYCSISPEAQHFIENLLRINPTQRLSAPSTGSGTSVDGRGFKSRKGRLRTQSSGMTPFDEIKRHAFFKSVDFDFDALSRCDVPAPEVPPQQPARAKEPPPAPAEHCTLS